MRSIDKPYVLYVAEKMYLEISKIKKNNPDFSNINAIENFIGSKVYEEISSGQFHDKMLAKLNNELINKKTKNKISAETIRLLEIQRDLVTKQLIQFPDLYYAKSHFPLEISQRAFDHLWRMCESYELWCKETNQTNLIVLKIID
jgi:hypothetical protein